ncbi:hypothetical protein RCO48_11290 [Peribacillus frigoritolerans]|nr:hypothetical protein [Peribacillus frigoritolerans]
MLPYRLNRSFLQKRTKTSTFGPVFNFIHTYKLGAAYITDGQNVPDDIEIATSSQLMKMAFGAKKNMKDQAENLRRRFEARQNQSMAKTIAVLSGKGGVGKSNFSLNFFHCLIPKREKGTVVRHGYRYGEY